MAMGIYTSPDPESILSQDDLFSKPFAITFDGRIGGYKEVKLYLRNDNETKYYTDLVLSLEDLSSPSVTDGTTDGFVWKLSYGDTKPTFNDWSNIQAANSLENVIDDIGGPGDPDTSTYLPFWVFIQIPPNTDVQVLTKVKFQLEGNEELV